MSTIKIRPFKHDCETCTWVSWFITKDTLYNIWVHDYEKEGGMGLSKFTLIFRYGDEPSEYASFPFPVFPQSELEWNKSEREVPENITYQHVIGEWD